jgi:D-glycero-D-manno-heptose 1,7-bisphosphate phosphatase
LFLDRDGVVNQGVLDTESGTLESPLRVEDVRLLPGVPAAMRALADAGYGLVCVTNQPAAAKGKVTVEALLGVHRRVGELLAQEGVAFAASFICPHHPNGTVDGLAGACPCRKPAPGMLLDAGQLLRLDLSRCWMVGDTDADMAAAEAAGCGGVLIEYSGSAHKRRRIPTGGPRAPDLPIAAARLLGSAPQAS